MGLHLRYDPEAVGRWLVDLVRYRTPTHAQRKRRFRRRAEAERFRAAVEHSKTEGLFVDPKAGRQTFAAYAERWLSTKVDVRLLADWSLPQ